MKQQPERAQQRAIVDLLRTIGGVVYTLGTVRKRGDYPGTMQSPGLPDLLVFLPVTDAITGATGQRAVWIEVKAATGRLSAAQAVFRRYCAAAGLEHVTGTLDAVIRWLQLHGYVNAGAR